MSEKWPDEYPDPEAFKQKNFFDKWPLFPDWLKPARQRRAILVLLLAGMLLLAGIIIGQAISFYTLSKSRPQAVLVPAHNAAPPTPLNVVTPLPTPYATPTRPPGPTPTPAAPLAGMIYRAEGVLWQAERGRHPRQVTGNTMAVVAPDGQTLASAVNGDLYHYPSGDDSGTVISRDGDRRICCLWWWPARPEYLLARFWHGADLEEAGVAVLSLSGETVLLAENEYRYDHPAASPNGDAVAYSQHGRPVLHYLSGEVEILDLPALGLPDYAVVTYPGWSADGERMTWLATDEPEEYGDIDMVVIDLAQRQGRVLHTITGTLHNGWLRAPVWSPDGRWLAYYDQGTWIIAAGGGEQHYFGEGYFPVWDPDGRYLVLNRRQGPLLLTVPGGYAIDLAMPFGSVVLEWRATDRDK